MTYAEGSQSESSMNDSDRGKFDPSYDFVESIEKNFRNKYNEYLENIKNKDLSNKKIASQKKTF